jgi:exosortase
MIRRISFIHPAWLFAAWTFFCCLVFARPLYVLIKYALANDNASHILIIPFIAAWLLYLDRAKIKHTRFHFAAALLPGIPAALLALVAQFYVRPANSALPIIVLSLLLLMLAGFVGIYGLDSLRAAWFGWAFLIFLIPFPERFLNRFVYSLQAGSASVAGLIFDWTGIPALREGFVFHLPKLSIEVAPECSGIRSSIALFILAVLVAHFSFSKLWKKVVFLAAGLLMMIIKNGVRIATLSILANYVNPAFLYGKLHHDGGVVFFLLGLALLIPVYGFLRRGEKTRVLHANEILPSTL